MVLDNIVTKKCLINLGFIYSSLDDVIVDMLASFLVGDVFFVDISPEIKREPVRIMAIRLGDCLVEQNREEGRVIGFEVECRYDLEKEHVYMLINRIKKKLYGVF